MKLPAFGVCNLTAAPFSVLSVTLSPPPSATLAAAAALAPPTPGVLGRLPPLLELLDEDFCEDLGVFAAAGTFFFCTEITLKVNRFQFI